MDDLISRQKVIDTIEKIKRIAENELYDGEVLRTFPSMTSASKYFNKNSKSPNGVLQCIKGKYKTAYGYKWRRVSI